MMIKKLVITGLLAASMAHAQTAVNTSIGGTSSLYSSGGYGTSVWQTPSSTRSSWVWRMFLERVLQAPVKKVHPLCDGVVIREGN